MIEAQTEALSADEALSAFPRGWVYSNASNEERDQFHALLGRLLAQEFATGLVATAAINQLIKAAKAIAVRAWIETVRRDLERMIEARQFLANHPLPPWDRKRTRFTTEAEKAARVLARAAETFDRANARKQEAESVCDRIRAEEQRLTTGDPVLLSAWQAFLELAGDAPPADGSDEGAESEAPCDLQP